MEILQLSQRKIQAWKCGRRETVDNFFSYFYIFNRSSRYKKKTYFALEPVGGFLHEGERGNSQNV